MYYSGEQDGYVVWTPDPKKAEVFPTVADVRTRRGVAPGCQPIRRSDASRPVWTETEPEEPGLYILRAKGEHDVSSYLAWMLPEQGTPEFEISAWFGPIPLQEARKQ